MSVVDDYRVGLAAINPLKSSWHVRQRGYAISNRFRAALSCRTGCRRCHDVVHIYATDQRRKDRDLLGWRHQIEARSPRSDVDFVCMKVAPVPSVRQYHGTMFPAESTELCAVLVIEVRNCDTRRIGAAALKQRALGCEIFVHRLVIV